MVIKKQNKQVKQQTAAQERLCNLFEPCESPEAPLCPLQATTIRTGIWYPDEPICTAKQFQDLSWIKKQKQIVALKLKARNGFFTVRMLDTIHTVTGYLKGADPDEPDAESNWLRERSGKQRKTIRRKRKSTDTKGENKKGKRQKPPQLL